jgi:hypothetical protein
MNYLNPENTRAVVLAVVLENDWSVISKKISALRDSLRKIQKDLKEKQRLTPKGIQFITSHYRQIKEDTSKLEEASCDSLTLKQRDLRTHCCFELEKHR